MDKLQLFENDERFVHHLQIEGNILENKMVIFNDNNEIKVDGRQLHMFLEVKTPYHKWFPRMCEYGFEDGKDFNTDKNVRVELEGRREVTREIVNHMLTLDMAKEIAMLQRNEKGKQARRYFIQIEKEYNNPENTIARALILVNRQLEERNKLIAEQTKQIAIMQPKAEFYDMAADSSSLFSMADVAKTLDMGFGRNKMFAKLRNKGILREDNTPYQRYVDAGYFKLVQSQYFIGGNSVVATTTYVKEKGIDFIRKILREDVV